MEGHQFANALRELFELAQEEEVDGDGFVNASPDVVELLGEDTQVRSFEEAGLLTPAPGLVFRLADGTEVQLTVVVR